MTYVIRPLVPDHVDDNRNDNRFAGSRTRSYYQNAAFWPANAVLTCGCYDRCLAGHARRTWMRKGFAPGLAIGNRDRAVYRAPALGKC